LTHLREISSRYHDAVTGVDVEAVAHR